MHTTNSCKINKISKAWRKERGHSCELTKLLQENKVGEEQVWSLIANTHSSNQKWMLVQTNGTWWCHKENNICRNGTSLKMPMLTKTTRKYRDWQTIVCWKQWNLILPLRKRLQMQKLSELEDANASKNDKKHDKNAKCNEPLIVNQPGTKYTTNKQKQSKAKQEWCYCMPRRAEKTKWHKNDANSSAMMHALGRKKRKLFCLIFIYLCI